MRDVRKRSLDGWQKHPPLSAVVAAVIFTAAAVALLIMPLLGYRVYVVTGDSMKGTFGRGALILTDTVPVESLEVGDIITFRPPHQASPVSHRIIAMSPQPDGRVVFRTRGDHNESPDPWEFTLDHKVQAKYVAHVPYAGYLFGFLGLRAVRAALIAGFGLLLVLAGFSAVWNETVGHPRSARSRTDNRSASAVPPQSRHGISIASRSFRSLDDSRS